MMELHEENKVMREALEIIASAYSTKCSIMAKEALAMIKRAKRSAQPEGGKQPSEAFAYVNHVVSKQFADGSLGKAIAAAQPEGRAAPVQHDSDCSIHNVGVPELLGPCDCSVTPAAQPEGEATLFQQMAKATIQSQAQFFLQKARAEKAEAETDEVRIAAREEITALVARAEKAEAELLTQQGATDRALKEMNIWLQRADTAESALVAQPAPQAGDALELPPLPEAWSAGSYRHDFAVYTSDHMQHYARQAIDTSRREAYDKGRAEGVGQELVGWVSERTIESLADAREFAKVPYHHSATICAAKRPNSPAGEACTVALYRAAPPASAAPAKLMSVPQVADMLREKNLLTESGMKTFLNGDALRFHPADIARIINAAFATQQVPK